MPGVWGPDVRWLEKLSFVLKARLAGCRVSSSAYLKGCGRIHLGRGCKVHADASLDASRQGRIECGRQVTVNRYAYIQADAGGVRLGDRVEINNFTIVNGTGGVSIGDDTLIGPGVRIVSYQHGIEPGQVIRDQPTIGRPIIIGAGAWIGANAVILAGVTIGDGAVVAAGAVVTRDVPAQAIVAGVPARVMRTR